MNIEFYVPVLLIIISLVFGQNDEEYSTLSPLEIICNQLETCQQYDKIETSAPSHKDLRTRKCMCDRKCPTYGDCCKDSKHYSTSSQKKYSFSCEYAPFDGYIYMVNKCASDYTSSSRIIENCHTTNRTSLVRNFLLTLPVTNSLKKITYKNAYCAICNYELNFDFWQPIFHYDMEKPDFDKILQNTSESLRSNKTNYQVVTGEMVFNNFTIDEKRARLKSEINGSSYLCNILPNVPSHLESDVRYCLPETNNALCSDCEKPTATNNCIAKTVVDIKKIALLDVSLPTLPRTNSCIDVPAYISGKNVFCSEIRQTVSSSTEFTFRNDIEVCYFINSNMEGKLCLINTFFAEGDYRLVNDLLYIPLYDYAFPPEEFVIDTFRNEAYVCGTEIPMSEEERKIIKYVEVLTKVLMILSIFLLILYLVTNASKQKLQSLPNKISFSISLTLLLLYLVFKISQGMKSCKIHAALYHYLSLSCVSWLLIATFDIWQVICRSSNKLQTLAGKPRLKRYLLYCLFGWCSPLPIMAIAIYCELSLNDVVPCSYKPGYGRQNQCFIAQEYPKLYLFICPVTIMICIIVALFAHTSYHIYLNKRKNIRSNVQNNYWLLFLKLALNMGLTVSINLPIGIAITYTNWHVFKFLYAGITSSQGIFMFLLYILDKKILKQLQCNGKLEEPKFKLRKLLRPGKRCR